MKRRVGRPKMKGEKRTANLCGVHLRPSHLAAYRDVARASATTVTKLVEMAMAVFIDSVQDNDPGDAFDSLADEYRSLDLDKVFGSYVKKSK